MTTVLEVSPQEAFHALSSASARLIDVREDDELVTLRTEIAQHVPLSRFDFTEFAKMYDRNAPLYILCRSGARSRRIGEALIENGYQKIYNITGGILAWQQCNLPLA